MHLLSQSPNLNQIAQGKEYKNRIVNYLCKKKMCEWKEQIGDETFVGTNVQVIQLIKGPKLPIIGILNNESN